MQPVGFHNAAQQFSALAPGNNTQQGVQLQRAEQSPNRSLEKAEEVREAFVSFFGQTFYGQMIKAMRSTLDKSAYFHGGRAEEIFQGQLDQTMAEELANTSADQIAEPMFERQFPQLALQLRQAENNTPRQTTKAQLQDLESLRRQ